MSATNSNGPADPRDLLIERLIARVRELSRQLAVADDQVAIARTVFGLIAATMDAALDEMFDAGVNDA